MDHGGDNFLSDILLQGAGNNVAGLDDLVIPLTPQETQISLDIEVVASRGNQGTKRSKNFNVEEKMNLFVKHGWLLAKIPSTGPTKIVPRFGVRFMLSLRRTKRQMHLQGQQVLYCIDGSQY